MVWGLGLGLGFRVWGVRVSGTQRLPRHPNIPEDQEETPQPGRPESPTSLKVLISPKRSGVRGLGLQAQTLNPKP